MALFGRFNVTGIRESFFKSGLQFRESELAELTLSSRTVTTFAYLTLTVANIGWLPIL